MCVLANRSVNAQRYNQLLGPAVSSALHLFSMLLKSRSEGGSVLELFECFSPLCIFFICITALEALCPVPHFAASLLF